MLKRIEKLLTTNTNKSFAFWKKSNKIRGNRIIDRQNITFFIFGETVKKIPEKTKMMKLFF